MSSKEEWKDHIIDTESRLLGPRSSYSYINDPRHILFSLSRYKFCAKILKGKKKVIEIGCGDATGSPLILQEVDSLLCVDIEEKLIKNNISRLHDVESIAFKVMDITRNKPEGIFDAAYSLDVLEHISKEFDDKYFSNICSCLNKDAIFIVGVPNIYADKYSSKPGHSPHVNLKNEDELRYLFSKYFRNILCFSMNDEVVHTGFSPMAHYLFCIGIGLK